MFKCVDSHPNGRDDEEVTPRKFRLAIKDEFVAHATRLNGSPFVWVTQPSRMARELGKVRELIIADQAEENEPAQNASAEDPTARTFNELYDPFHVQLEHWSKVIEGRSDIFFRSVMLQKGMHNVSYYIIIRVCMYVVEAHIQDGGKLDDKKFSVHRDVFKLDISESGHSLLAFAPSKRDDKNRDMVKNVLTKSHSRISQLKQVFQSDNLLKVDPKIFDDIDREKWDTMIQTETKSDLTRIVTLFPENEELDQQVNYYIANDNWNAAVDVFLNERFFNQAFFQWLIDLRMVWMRAKKKFLLSDEENPDPTTLESYMRQLNPFIRNVAVKRNTTDTKVFFSALFGDA